MELLYHLITARVYENQGTKTKQHKITANEGPIALI